MIKKLLHTAVLSSCHLLNQPYRNPVAIPRNCPSGPSTNPIATTQSRNEGGIKAIKNLPGAFVFETRKGYVEVAEKSRQ